MVRSQQTTIPSKDPNQWTDITQLPQNRDRSTESLRAIQRGASTRTIEERLATPLSAQTENIKCSTSTRNFVMAALRTGQYNIVFFDTYGNRIKKIRPVHAGNLMQAIRKGRRYAKLCNYHSYRIDRAVYNSLDPREDY